MSYQIVDAASEVPQNAIPFLGGVNYGYAVDVRTPLFKGADRDKVARQWMKVLDANERYLHTRLIELEHKQGEKIGPMSIRLPLEERREDISAYYDKGDQEFKIDYSELHFGNLLNGQQNRLRPLSAANAARTLPQNTNSGLPYFKKRNTVISESIRLADDKEAWFPALLGWRGQANGTNTPKQRVVWMFPYSTNIKEARFFRPMHEILVNRPQFAAWISMDEVDNRMTGLFKYANHDREYTVLSSDFSSYDQSLTWQQDVFTHVMHGNFQSTSSVIGDLDMVLSNLRTIPLVVSPTEMYVGKHGVPSGSTFTNMLDSIVNYVFQISSPVAEQSYIQVQGDDAVLLVKSVDEHLSYLNNMGFEANAEKQYVSSDGALYLQHLYDTEYVVDGIVRGVYPTMRALNSLLGQERFHSEWDENMVTLRVISILENCKWHPLFSLFIKFVAEYGDKRLKANTVKIINDPAIIEKSMSMPGFIPTYNSIPLSYKGIQSFKSVFEILKL
jgi:hypothetical protein